MWQGHWAVVEDDLTEAEALALMAEYQQCFDDELFQVQLRVESLQSRK
jgi:hypothetical protein